MGNQSADLDSMISAIVYSYFFSRMDKAKRGRGRDYYYVPLVNIPDVPSGPELRRLRPEFACALELSVSSESTTRDRDKGGDDGIVQLLKEHVLTVADLRNGLLSASDFAAAAAAADRKGDKNSKLDLDCVLVDWNSLPHKTVSASASEEGNVQQKQQQGKGSIEGLSDLVHFSVSACIDHHVDEGFVPPLEHLSEGNPRVIELGPGSCTSLVIREVRERGLWSSPPSSSTSTSSDVQEEKHEGGDAEVQIAKLALAAILIDTNNLKAKDKVTDVDRDAVSFLTQRILSSSAAGAGKGWSRDSFFEQIHSAKAHSLDWLTVNEILGRDYKDWTESTPSGEKRVIGIASVVRPLEWIIKKANGEEDGASDSTNQNLDSFLSKLQKFATEKHLDVVSVMTAFTSDDEEGGFARELLVWGLNDDCSENIQRFSRSSKEELHLQKWNEFPVDGSQEYKGDLLIWKQGNLAKSRKQVAPLLRKSISN